MHERHYLIADDVDEPKVARMRAVAERDPYAVVHIARSAREALGIIGRHGKRMEKAYIDFDFLGEAETGADIIAAQRAVNRHTFIALVTAREGEPYEEARNRALGAGADATFTSADAFEAPLAQAA